MNVYLSIPQSQIPVVRAQAASSLEFLQDPSPQCPVTNALLSLMEKDSSPEVRRTILNKIAVSNRTLSGEALRPASMLVLCQRRLVAIFNIHHILQ